MTNQCSLAGSLSLCRWQDTCLGISLSTFCTKPLSYHSWSFVYHQLPLAAVDPFTGRSLPQNLGRGSARQDALLIKL